MKTEMSFSTLVHSLQLETEDTCQPCEHLPHCDPQYAGISMVLVAAKEDAFRDAGVEVGTDCMEL